MTINNYQKHNVLYLSLDSIISLYESNNMDYSKFGLVLASKTPICELMYVQRKKRKAKSFLYLNKNSYDMGRKKVIDTILDILFRLKFTGKSLITISGEYSKIKYLIDWIDESKIAFPQTVIQAKELYIRYTTFLRLQIKTKGSDGKYEVGLQHSALYFLENLFNDSHFIGEGVPKMERSGLAKENVLPKVDIYTESLQFFYDIFTQLSQLILKKEEFPALIKVSDKEYYIANYGTSFVVKKDSKDNLFVAFDSTCGRIKTFEEMIDIDRLNRYDTNDQKCFYKRNLKTSISKIIANFNEADNRNFSEARRWIANTAMQSYFMLFLFQTGMNDSTAAGLKWNDDYIIEKDEQNFRTIKYRAGNKPVEFNIQSNFIQDFKKFIELRSYVLQKEENPYLFFMYNTDKKCVSNPVSQFKGSYNGVIRKSLANKFNTKVSPITSRDLRRFKGNFIVEKHGASIAAKSLQNNLSTTLNKYVAAQKEKPEIELSSYFDKLNSTILSNSNKDLDTSIGKCSSYGNPCTMELPRKSEIAVDCKQQEGCLFCSNYKIHADRDDIDKLHSLLYVLEETKYIAEDINQYNLIFMPVINRAQSLVAYFKENVSEKLVEESRCSVFDDELLHPYWEHKLSLLNELGVLK
jgi:hypothetical protein